LQKQAKPNGVELAEDEYILHVDGTVVSQRVVRHIGTTSWPGQLLGLSNHSFNDVLEFVKNILKNCKCCFGFNCQVGLP